MNELIPLVSFPKSGNTWMRFLLANIFKSVESDAINFENINEYVPTDANDSSVLSNLKEGAPLFIKEHASYSGMKYHNFSKAIYIYRDGFDSLLSYWHFVDAQQPGLYGDIDVFSKYYWSYCGHWGEHINSWLFNEDTLEMHDVFSISYEELIKSPLPILIDLMVFLEEKVDEDALREAIELSDKKNMKKMSGSAEFMNAKNKGFHFVRSANTGDAKESLNDSCKEKFICQKLNYEMMMKLGYLSYDDNSWKNMEKFDKTYFFDRVNSKYIHLKYKFLKKKYV